MTQINPPFSLEVEATLLSSLCLADIETVKDILTNCPTAAIYSTMGKAIFSTIRNAINSNMRPDCITVANKVTEISRGVYTQYKVMEFLTSSNVIPTTDIQRMQYHVFRLKELLLQRLALTYTYKVQQYISQPDEETIFSVASEMHKFDVAKSALFKPKISFDEQLKLAIDRINTRREYVETTFRSINNIIGGYTRKNVSVLAGKPSHNKTTFSIQELADMTKFIGFKTLFVSAEESAEMVWRRIISRELLIPLDDMRFKRVQVDYNKVANLLRPIYKDKFIVVDQIYKPDDIVSVMRAHKPDIVVIDYIQRLDLGDDLTRGIESAVKLFKNTAKSLDCHVKLIAQVDAKGIDKREDKIPRISDVMWSQYLHQEASEFGVIYWHYKHSMQDIDKNLVDLIFWKHRYGDTSSTKLHFLARYGKFGDVPVKNV